MSPISTMTEPSSDELLTRWRGRDELAGRLLVCRHHDEVFARVAALAQPSARGALIRAVFRELHDGPSSAELATFGPDLDEAIARVLRRHCASLRAGPLVGGPLSETVDHAPPH